MGASNKKIFYILSCTKLGYLRHVRQVPQFGRLAGRWRRCSNKLPLGIRSM
jgi:hypothetical protein